jgi:hypothetical protein
VGPSLGGGLYEVCTSPDSISLCLS